jgi:hypothetical protein
LSWNPRARVVFLIIYLRSTACEILCYELLIIRPLRFVMHPCVSAHLNLLLLYGEKPLLFSPGFFRALTLFIRISRISTGRDKRQG